MVKGVDESLRDSNRLNKRKAIVEAPRVSSAPLSVIEASFSIGVASARASICQVMTRIDASGLSLTVGVSIFLLKYLSSILCLATGLWAHAAAWEFRIYSPRLASNSHCCRPKSRTPSRELNQKRPGTWASWSANISDCCYNRGTPI